MFHRGRIPIFSSSRLNGVSSIGKNTFKAENNQRKCITAQFHNNLWTSFGRSKCDFSRMTIFRMLIKYSIIINNERGKYNKWSNRILNLTKYNVAKCKVILIFKDCEIYFRRFAFFIIGQPFRLMIYFRGNLRSFFHRRIKMI